MPPRTIHAAGQVIGTGHWPLADPRRPGKTMALITCAGCGRVYTLTPEVAHRYVNEHTWPCPDPDCGKGAE